MINRQFVKTNSCYVALYDESSATNRRGFMANELAACKQAAKRAGQEEFYGLFHFNDYLTQCAAQGQMLAWTLLFDGIFSLDIRVGSLLDDAVAAKPRITEALPSSSVLHCPTGRLIVSCLSEMGAPVPVAIEVAPGEYQATLVRAEEAELDHAFLEKVTGEMRRGGPDWKILLRRVDV